MYRLEQTTSHRERNPAAISKESSCHRSRSAWSGAQIPTVRRACAWDGPANPLARLGSTRPDWFSGRMKFVRMHREWERSQVSETPVTVSNRVWDRYDC